MIFDRVENAGKYSVLHEKFAEAFAFIARATAEGLPVGRYELDGDRLYAIVQEYDTKPQKEGVYEGHRAYIDIQYIIGGFERIDMIDISCVEAKTEYDDERDFLLFHDAERETQAILGAGEFGIFYPNDIHKPGLAVGAPAPIQKIVVKVKL